MARYYAIGSRPMNGQTGRPVGEQELGGRFTGGDMPERALPIITALLDGGYDEPALYAWGGMCAVCLNDYDLAEKLLTKAEAEGQFEGLPQVSCSRHAHRNGIPLEGERLLWQVANIAGGVGKGRGNPG